MYFLSILLFLIPVLFISVPFFVVLFFSAVLFYYFPYFVMSLPSWFIVVPLLIFFILIFKWTRLIMFRIVPVILIVLLSLGLYVFLNSADGENKKFLAEKLGVPHSLYREAH